MEVNGNGVVKLKKNIEFCEKTLTEYLIFWQVIDPKFTGSVTFHFSQGGLSEIDKYEKGLRKKLNSDIR
jgi:hypothetical protein